MPWDNVGGLCLVQGLCLVHRFCVSHPHHAGVCDRVTHNGLVRCGRMAWGMLCRFTLSWLPVPLVGSLPEAV